MIEQKSLNFIHKDSKDFRVLLDRITHVLYFAYEFIPELYNRTINCCIGRTLHETESWISYWNFDKDVEDNLPTTHI